MNYLRAFIAGLVIPSVLLPIAACLAIRLGKPQLLEVGGAYWMPVIWGIWNVLFVGLGRILPFSYDVRLFIKGALLGLLVAAYAIFWVHVPEIAGFPERWKYLPLIVAPLAYALLWRYGVKWLNALLGVKTS